MQNRLTVYQIEDSLDLELPLNSVDLVISSPPLDILTDCASDLFEWLDKYVAPEGVLLLDMPGQYNQYTIKMWEGEKKTAWHFQWGVALHDFYQVGDTQSLCAYSRQDFPKPREIPYRRCTERGMTHRCEYDAIYIKNLIEKFTNPYETVLDPFCGTGTVPKLAYRLKRNGLGIDRRCPFTNQYERFLH